MWQPINTDTTMTNAAIVVRRRENEPFGGVQVVLAGDFLQLPPVEGCKGIAYDSDLAFAARAWRQPGGVETRVLLRGNYRQGEGALAAALVRPGRTATLAGGATGTPSSSAESKYAPTRADA